MKLFKPVQVHVDFGHGGPADRGAVHDTAVEAMINLAIGRWLVALLDCEGFYVSTSRTLDVPVSLDQRCQLVNQVWRPDLLISLHANSHTSPGPNGLEIFTSPGQTAADPIAEIIIDSLRNSLPDTKMRTDLSDGDQDKEARFQLLTHTFCPALLVELGFLSNKKERLWLSNPDNHVPIASALCSAIMTWRAAR